MADIATTGALTAIGYPLVQKVLGPSAEYLGDQLKLFTEKNTENIKNIFKKAEKKLSASDEESSLGQVSPQIVKDIIFDGSFCEDEITQEYYAGILASSKTTNPLENRGKAIASLIRELSTYQLTAHYILYYIYVAYVDGQVESFKDAVLSSFVDNSTLIEAFHLSKDDSKKIQVILEHVFYGLQGHNLVKGIEEINQGRDFSSYSGQYNYLPTPKGIELFLWANGYGSKPIDFLYSKECLIYEIEGLDFNF